MNSPLQAVGVIVGGFLIFSSLNSLFSVLAIDLNVTTLAVGIGIIWAVTKGWIK